MGCTNLRCRACGQQVQFERELPAGQDGRTYQCACRTYREDKFRAADDDDERDPALPWRCGGHSTATLPFDLDGVKIGRDTDFATLVRKTLAGWSPPSARPSEREQPYGWASKLHVRLTDTELKDAVSGAAAPLLSDADAFVRGAALRFFCEFPAAMETACIEGLLLGDRAPFLSQDPTVRNVAVPLESSLLRLLGRRIILLRERNDPDLPHLLELARAEVLRRDSWVQALYHFLWKADPDWLMANVKALVTANPEQWRDLLGSLSEGAAGEAGERIARLPGVDAKELESFARLLSAKDSRRQILAALGKKK